MRSFLCLLMGGVFCSAVVAQVSFAPAVHYPSGGDASTLVVDDLDSDGDRDVLVDNQYTVSVLPNLGSGTFGPRILSSAGLVNVSRVCPADVDQDGSLDLLVALFDGGVPVSEVGVMLGSGSSGFALPTTLNAGYPNDNAPYDVACGNLNGDSFPDFAIGTSHGDAVRIYFSNGSGGLFAGPSVASNEVKALAVGDLDGDGDMDIAASENYSTANGNIKVHLGNGLGGFSLGGTFPAGTMGGPGPESVCIEDLDGDGDLDVVAGRRPAASGGYVGVLLNNGNATFAPVQDFPVPHSAYETATADVDGDGLPEIIASDPLSSVVVLPNLGGGMFGSPVIIPVNGGPSDVVAQDVNGDGRPDLIAAVGSEVAVILNTTPVAPGGAPYPGTGEDLSLLTGINGATPTTGTGEHVKSASVGDTVQVLLSSPMGGFALSPFIMAAQPFPAGSPPATFPGYPSVHVSSPGMVFLFDSTIGPFPNLIGPGGFVFTTAAPVSLSGQSVMFQAVALSGAANNGLFAATDAHEIQVQ